jgi:phosphoribosylamine---glycine ligase
MDKVGILIVSKCLSSSAMIDAFQRSERYVPEFYVLERQVNPFNFERARVHRVLPDLDVAKVARFARRHKEDLAFGLTDTEDFITAGGRDVVEAESGVPMICVTGEFAVEKSKADQRLLFERVCPGANPRYRVFDPKEYPSEAEAVSEMRRLSGELGGGFVIKPDAPARGAGVGVWGKDFRTEEEAVEFFKNVYSKGRVVVEERIEGEESSFHAFSDGRHFVPAPLTRDYKRSLDGDKGKLTGGMGSYRGPRGVLPFLPPSEWERVVRLEREAFEKWKGKGSNPGLRGIVLYDALMHTKGGFKILERNSRGGNTEQISILTTMLDDYVDVCYRMLDGALKGIRFSNEASVVTCAVPLGYGGAPAPGGVEESVDLGPAFALEKRRGGDLRVFPMDLRLDAGTGRTLIGSSRSVAVAGIAHTLEEAHDISVQGVRALGGQFRHRDDVGSAADIARSKEHLRSLRRATGPQASPRARRRPSAALSS